MTIPGKVGAMPTRPIGTVEIAARLNVSPATVRKWRERFGRSSTMHDGAPRFPDADAWDGNRPLYYMSSIREWKRAADPYLKPGRPPVRITEPA